jgi:uncharacterized membrane protein
VLLAAALGVAVFAASARAGAPRGLASLMGWNAAAAAFLTVTLQMIWRDDEATVRKRAAWEDENNAVTLLIVLSAVAAGLAGTVVAMHEAKAAAAHVAGADPWAWVFSVSTLLLGWMTVQTIFSLHYAHKYFGDGDADGAADGGVQFPGQPPTTYHDFFYMAVCIGASGQVSDFNITSSSLRRLVTLHALLAFFFNTAVLALGINILATLIGQ